MEEIFSLRDGLYLEISKLSRMRSSKLEEDLQEEMTEKSWLSSIFQLK